ncbi:hypothetical protein N7481_006082 [Penicillium waksmanii]|uniref:uncharacterized protein n=1 Tax=Penicillium waksmanii TaxID=69791 RepID=UPI00254871A4|nr:uncharacterized protein N7481_006082 [Penicillium waksmanii]KAJ5983983.1 hypothetical protein N7481_006082 [Penicillium waksmanii]
MLSTPARQRSTAQSRPPPSARGSRTPRTSTIPDLPPYEAPEAPLTAECQRQLNSLLQSKQLHDVKTHIQNAADRLTDSVGEVNERLCDARNRYETNKERKRSANEEIESDDEDEELQLLAEKERQVDDVTGRMEVQMRQIIDSENRLSELTESVRSIEREEAEAQTAALGVRQTRGQRRMRRQQRDGDEEGEDDLEDEDYEGTPEREIRERNAQNPPSRRLEDKLVNGAQEWDGLSLTERYARNNNYIGFYRMVHDSKFPGDEVPPMPSSSTWFSHLEDTNGENGPSDGNLSRQNMRTRNRREPSPADSDEIAIQRERISLKCPLTLLPFQDPVTSTKCPHSFEREAITDMIARSTRYAPDASRPGRRLRAVKCPVCSILLTNEDLRTDPVLLRKVRRAEELEKREADDDDEMGESGREGGANEVTLGSDAESSDEDGDAMEVDGDSESDRTRIKSEPAARIKREGTMIPHASQQVEAISSDDSE